MTGYQSKRAAAQDKLDNDDLTIAYQSGYYDGKKAAQPAQEPVASCNGMPVYEGPLSKALTQDLGAPLTINGCALYPQRPWVDLTDEDIENLFQSAAGADEETHIRFARAIETALRSKNNG